MLKAERQRAGLTQSTVAELLGEAVAFETISRFERGAAAPSLGWIARMAELYGTTIDAILAATLREPPPSDPTRTELQRLAKDLPDADVPVVLALLKAYVQATRERQSM